MKKSIPHLIRDEKQAISDYRDSAKATKHTESKRVFNHIRPEEEEHKRELTKLKHNLAKKMK